MRSRIRTGDGMQVGDSATDISASPEVERTRRVYRWFSLFYDPFRLLWGWWTRPIERDLDRLFREGIGTETRILELAPGTGINVERLFRCAEGFESYLGIDSSEEMLEYARRRSRGDPRIKLQVGDANELEAIGEHFDLIISTWLLSHLDHPEATVENALGKLAPGGIAVFVFVTAPRPAILRAIVRWLGGPFRFEPVDPEPIRRLPGLERLSNCASGIATITVFRAPAA